MFCWFRLTLRLLEELQLLNYGARRRRNRDALPHPPFFPASFHVRRESRRFRSWSGREKTEQEEIKSEEVKRSGGGNDSVSAWFGNVPRVPFAVSCLSVFGSDEDTAKGFPECRGARPTPSSPTHQSFLSYTIVAVLCPTRHVSLSLMQALEVPSACRTRSTGCEGLFLLRKGA